MDQRRGIAGNDQQHGQRGTRAGRWNTGMPFLRRRRADAATAMDPAALALRRPAPAAVWIILMVLLVGGAVAATMWWLLADLAATTPPAPTQPPGSGASSPPAPPSGGSTPRGEILRTALAAGAGVGAAVTLALAFRRQRHQEVATLAATHDANERRVTELYTAAAEQLGSDKAAVRLAGLYALERLAQDNPDHRQTIVNVICAYLRMPYTPPTPVDPEKERKAALREARRRYQAARAFGGSAVAAATPPATAEADPEGERQVRLTAQRILGDHLRDERPVQGRDTIPAGPRFWAGMRLDLTGATLIDFDFGYGHPADATFSGVTFSGDAWFVKATFSRHAWFGGVTFSGDALFDMATFSGGASFREVTFSRDALFDEAVARAPNAHHVWPVGWHLEPLPDGTGRLVRDEDTSPEKTASKQSKSAREAPER
ncbi:pentapeptide repeat-containing protein [Nonomuraea aridisoli]|uniref:pentapeptide repeat-containing protein n=1 Tax=Nonomuraea aridisoli TaxID=2070368 RepID=UPI001C6505DE|nr:pentapeptide repeat-containing protein [Nonomuraea aridisoli]